jgi:hypothetical protein
MPGTMIRGADRRSCAVSAGWGTGRHRTACVFALCLFALGVCMQANAGTIVLRILATNPSDKPQTVQVKSNLPPRVGTNDIVSLGDLELGYDVKNGVYYVHKEAALDPGQTATYDVEIRDIWMIPEKDLADLGAQSKSLVAKMTGHKLYESAQALQRDIARQVDQIAAARDAGLMKPGVKPIDHIRAYEASLKALGSVRRDLGRLENLVLGAGRDPGAILGEVQGERIDKPAPVMPAGTPPTAVIRIMVSNPSPEEKRTVPIRRDLPPEIRLEDILDAGGLEAAVDSSTQLCYVHKDEVTIEPKQTVTFDVQVRDKWNVNRPRIESLKAFSTNMLVRITRKEKFASVARTLRGLIGDLDAIAAETGPTELTDGYVAFYREQARRVSDVEQKIDRIASALRAIEKTARFGFPVKPPSMKTTWLIIYIILGFLAVVSLLFFLRWFGRSREEKL